MRNQKPAHILVRPGQWNLLDRSARWPAGRRAGGRSAARLALLAVAIAVPGALAPAGAQDGAQDAPPGKPMFDNACATCHGRSGQDTARGQARRLDTLSQEEVISYLRSKQGAPHPQKVYERIKAALSDAEIDALAAYIARLRKP